MQGLSVTGLTVRYGGVTALDAVDVEARRGAITGLIGPNGSGKSSFINVVSGALGTRFEGSAALDGVDLRKVKAHGRAKLGMGRIFQGIRLFDTLTVEENILLGSHSSYRHGMAASVLRTPAARREMREQREKAHELMSMFGTRLLPRRKHQVLSLSYANRRRVELSRALMTDPSMMLLDEPMAGMNPHETEELSALLRQLSTERNISMLLVEHKMPVITELCSDVYVLDAGKVIAHDTPANVQNDPVVVEAFLG
ncbi:ABC transporter ATP-binding protein [Nocardioides hungaricus]